MFAKIVFPLPFRNAFTYSIPPEFESSAKVGVRAVVPFGKRILTGYIIDICSKAETDHSIKNIKDILDDKPIFDKDSLKFYEWISEYYLSSLGEALRNSVPYGSDVETKRKIVVDQKYCIDIFDKEKNQKTLKSLLLKTLAEKETHSIYSLQKKLKKKNIYHAIRSLEKEGALSVLDELDEGKVRVKKLKFVKLTANLDEVYNLLPEIERRSPKQVVLLLELLSNPTEEIQQTLLLNKTKSSQSSLNSLIKKEIVEVFEKEVVREYQDEYSEETKKIKLTGNQKKVIDEIIPSVAANEFGAFLLHGVTGSGKTQIYIELTKAVIAGGKTAIILVPEISLTPQITSRFVNVFSDKVTVLHSRMSLGERYDSWRGIISGRYSVVIGARSALFAPLKNIGLIVVDEEHDSSYKQNEIVPKYQARDSAVIRANLSGCPILLGSATPSLESMFNAEQGKYKLLELKERIDDAKLPSIKLVDVTYEQKQKKMDNAFSHILLEEVDKRLTRKESVIILQNRRGFSTQVFCQDCGEIELCGDCSVSMVHHINRNIIQCHYCGQTRPVPRACQNCGSLSLKFFGSGTQRIEDELAYHFSKAKIDRMDSDSISKKGDLSFKLNSFRKGEIDILVGTQMVSKGMDFPNVTLVGVVSAETTLWLPDFRADERTFQLLTQVAGRAGRSKIEGEVIIQTQNKNHFVLQRVLKNDYDGFYKNELKLRKSGEYPPFTRLALIESRNENEKKAQEAIKDFYNRIKQLKTNLKLLPPVPALISKLRGFYRYHLMIKSYKHLDPGGKHLRQSINDAMIDYNQKSKFRDIKLIVDIDPQNVL
ncbi:MAG: primosomal protein N' [Bacteroidetes bacterium]|nr:primosomal protein N' [Bacteroidota bacterium]